MEKSSIIPVGRVVNVESLAREVGCKVGELPFTYLGSNFSAVFNDWEIDDVLNLLAAIHGVRLNPDRIYNLVWSISKSGVFIVKSCYDKLMGGNVENFPIKLIWNNCIPTKISFFAWEVWWGKILTMEQLKKRGRHLANRCPLCGKEEESLDHLLLRYSKVYNLWALCFLQFLGFTGSSQVP